MIKRIFWLFILLLLSSSKNLMALSPTDCNDPDTVFCMDLADGDGAEARDRSRSGLTGTLTGGPAWVNQSAALPNIRGFLVSSNTFVMAPPRYVQFTKTSGEEVATANNSVGNFSASVGMIAVCWQDSIIEPDDSPQMIFGWGAAANGWVFQNKVQVGLKGAFFQNTPFANAGGGFTMQIADRNPHSYGVWYDGTTTVLFKDGEIAETATGVSYPSATLPFNFAKDSAAEFGGGVWGARVWNKIVPLAQAQDFFTAYHQYWLGGGQ